MDIIFEYNPRKAIPREIMDQRLEEKGLRRNEERKAYEARQISSHSDEKSGHEENV